MGWTSGQLDKPHTAVKLIEFELGPEFVQRVIATHKKGTVATPPAGRRPRVRADPARRTAERDRPHQGDGRDRAPLLLRLPATDPRPAEPDRHDATKKWRARCRMRAARPRPRKGQQVTFAEPIAFTDGKDRSRFSYEGGSRFRAEDGTLVRISRWPERGHTLD